PSRPPPAAITSHATETQALHIPLPLPCGRHRSGGSHGAARAGGGQGRPPAAKWRPATRTVPGPADAGPTAYPTEPYLTQAEQVSGTSPSASGCSCGGSPRSSTTTARREVLRRAVAIFSPC